MDKWDEIEKKQPTTVIDFRGNHIHEMDRGFCKTCGWTEAQIKDWAIKGALR